MHSHILLGCLKKRLAPRMRFSASVSNVIEVGAGREMKYMECTVYAILLLKYGMEQKQLITELLCAFLLHRKQWE